MNGKERGVLYPISQKNQQQRYTDWSLAIISITSPSGNIQACTYLSAIYSTHPLGQLGKTV
ncbi:hypothetical protein [Ralstonia solanacearum]|nr:hypothetical protein [Ralstonia solanacearum]MCL9824331.1 hypothetical protein [Ralstonia solanacearum]MCL9848050.1 hypothetical protein [Ralstonia solanacearum]MCL9854857.1 hypothetical protein [Ralstonia solanacearum]MCL9860412.1 hypothetical protein [Ralstonia solanacearum]MCL9864831.1 hypothetical protein [Ralstonia solanacearum]